MKAASREFALAAILIMLSATDQSLAQTENTPPARRATKPADIRVQRPRTPSEFFGQETVHFQRARVDSNGALFAVILDYHPAAASLVLLVSSGVLLYHIVRLFLAEYREASKRRVR